MTDLITSTTIFEICREKIGYSLSEIEHDPYADQSLVELGIVQGTVGVIYRLVNDEYMKLTDSQGQEFTKLEKRLYILANSIKANKAAHKNEK